MADGITGEEWTVARRLWPDDEDTDFTLTAVPPDNGTTWIKLSCSVHGLVVASVTWDLGDLAVQAERHYVLRHLRPNARRRA